MADATGVVDLDGPTTEPNYEEPTGLTLDQVDDDLNPLSESVDTPDYQEPTTVEAPWYESHQDDLVTVKVDGREVQVPFKEALMGYQRQQDYTRKTTEIAQVRKAAEWGQAMQHALQTDPVRTLQELAQALGIGFNPNADQSLGEEVFDPEDARIAQLQAHYDSQLQSINAEIEVARMQRELTGLQAKYGADFEPTEVISYVQEQMNNGRDVSFEQAFHIIQGQKALEERRAAAERAEREKRARATGARTATQTVNRPNGRSQGVDHLQTDKELTLRDIFNLEYEGVS